MGNSSTRNLAKIQQLPTIPIEDGLNSEATTCTGPRSPSPHPEQGEDAFSTEPTDEDRLLPDTQPAASQTLPRAAPQTLPRRSAPICRPGGCTIKLKVRKKDVRCLLDEYCTRSYGSHSTMTSVDLYYKELFQYQRRIDSLDILREMGHSLAQGQTVELVEHEFVEKIQTKKAEALQAALERGKHYVVGFVAPRSGMLQLCPKDNRAVWLNGLKRTLDEEYDHANEEARHFLNTYMAGDEAVNCKLDEALERQKEFWETELEALFDVWQDATSSFLDQTFSKNEVFDELDMQARILAKKVAKKVEKAEEHLPNWMKRSLLSRNHELLSEITARLLHLDLWQHAHGLTHGPRTELIKVLYASLHCKILLGKLLFTAPATEELAKLSQKNGSVLLSEESTLATLVVEAAQAYFESLIRKNRPPPPCIEMFPGLLGAASHGLLVACAKAGNELWVGELLRSGVSPLESSPEGTPAMIALYLGHNRIVSAIQGYLIEEEALNQRMLTACFHCNIDEVRHLLSGRGTVACMTGDKWTPLHIATYMGSDKLVNLLIDENSDVNAADKQGSTPLHICVESRRSDMVELLVQADADIYQKDARGSSPLDLAREMEYQEAVLVLTKAKRRASQGSFLSRLTSIIFD
eukprot:GEMP01010382.1.p1 GENE.GEMP01010382.1~~GEMP01010382.1.p1  ORF type:complete len:637 (+),score=137.93 GEMP01010382.1:91-2001(+)